jgi:hypothetical protein
MKMLALFLLASVAQAATYRHDGTAVLNDLSVTPGKANPALTEKVLCSPSFRTAPYRLVEESTKKRACAEYGLKPAQCTGQKVEIDHLVSLEIGGSNDLANLWPEPYLRAGGAKQKDVIENALHKMVCAGKITLPDAQACISRDWYSCAKKLGVQ